MLELIIENFMTLMPHTIEKNMPVTKAMEVMRQNQIRHLPVLQDAVLVGILSDRDVEIAKVFPGPSIIKVGDVMTQDPYAVLPKAKMTEVIGTMVRHKYGCALVTNASGKVIGVFTALDGLKLLQEYLQK